MEKVRVLVADDQRLIREGISSLLALQEGIEVAGTAVNGSDALEKIRETSPDVALMDIQMPEMDGITATEIIRRDYPACKVIMLTTFDDDDYIVKSLRAGAVGYLLKDIPPDELAQAVRLAYSGIYQLSPSVAGKLIGDIRDPVFAEERGTGNFDPPPGTLEELTARERDVLKLIAEGSSNREIAELLCVSEGTVKNHVSSILNRLDLRDRTQIALFAYKHKLI